MEPNEMCQALTTSGKPCKKKSKKNECYCSTHLTFTTGVLSGTANSTPLEQDVSVSQNNSSKMRKCFKKSNNTREVEIREIRGIPYYIDGEGQVYKHEEIQQDNPTIIGRFYKNTGSIDFSV